MSILVVAATEAELAPFRNQFPEADVLFTGVGMYATLFELIAVLHTKKYDQVIQVGIAGAYEKSNIGQAFLVSKDRFADLGVWEQGAWKSTFDLGLSDANQLPFVNGWLENKHPYLQRTEFTSLPAISVNMLTDRQDWTQLLQQRFNAELETMEGAAFHYVCERLQLPYLQIRGISNQIGDRDKSNWKITEAIQTSCDLLSFIYQQLKKD